MRRYDQYEPKEMTPLERLRDQAHFWAYSGRDIMYQRRENNLVISKDCYEKSLALYRRIGQEYPSLQSQLDIYNTLNAYMELCLRINTREAMVAAKRTMEEALEIITDCVEKTPDDPNLTHKQIDTLQLLGGICRDIGGRNNLLLARRYFEQSIQVCDSIATETFDQQTWYQMAEGLEQFSRMNTALYGAKAAATAKECLETALALRIRLFRKNFETSAMCLAQAYVWLGDAYRDLGGADNLKAARHNYEMACRIWVFVRKKHESIYYATLHIGVLYRMAMLPNMETDKARQYLTQAIEIASRIAPVKGYEQWKGYTEMLRRLRDRL